jgi:hypothetical protein
MAVRLPAIAPQPEPTPQERSASLLQGVLSAIMQPSKAREVDTDVDKMIRTMRAQSFVEGLARMQPAGDAGRADARKAEAARLYHAIGAIGAAAGGLPFDQMSRSENVEDWRNRPVPITLENATVIEDVFFVQREAEKRGEPIALRALMKRMGEIQDMALAQPEPPPLPAVTNNPLAAAAGYNDIEALLVRARALQSGTAQ